METQLENLKLNAKNIKSSLVFSNKKLAKLRSDKKALFKKITLQDKQLSKEKRIETKMRSGFSNVASAVTAPVKSVFDKVMDFLGLLVANLLYNELPKIITKIEEFLNSDFIKSAKSVFEIIGKGFTSLARLLGFLSPEKQNEIDADAAEIGKIADEDNELYDDAEKEEKGLLSWLIGYEKKVDLVKEGEEEEEKEDKQQSSGMSPEQLKEAQDKINADRASGKTSDLRGGGGNVAPQPTPPEKTSGKLISSKKDASEKSNPLREGNEQFSEIVDRINQLAKNEEENIKKLESLLREISNGLTSLTPTSPGDKPRVKIHDKVDLSPFTGNVISVGRAILNQGFTVAENKYFTKNYWSGSGPNPGGFNPKGNSRVGKHGSRDHGTNALDITDWRGSEASGVPRLKNLFMSLYQNRQKYGIKALIYDPSGYWFQGMRKYSKQPYGGHSSHLHVGFTVSADTIMKKAKTNERLISLKTTGSMPSESESEQTVVVVKQNNVKVVPAPIPITKSLFDYEASAALTSEIWGN